MSIDALKEAMGKNPKILRTVRHNKHPIIMNPEYSKGFEEYKLLGDTKLKERAFNLIKKSKKFAENVSFNFKRRS